MAEAHQARVQKTIEDMVQSLERDHIRKMQVSHYANEISTMSNTYNVIQYIVQCIIYKLQFYKSPSFSRHRSFATFYCQHLGLYQVHSSNLSCECIQGLMFKCSAECCERSTDSMSQVHNCIERCHAPLAQAQGLVTNELEKFQVSFMWCWLWWENRYREFVVIDCD